MGQNAVLGELFRGNECFSASSGVFCLGDARGLIKRIPGGYVDAVVTDPPWGVGSDEHDDPEAFFAIEEELYRVMKSDSWLIFYYTPKRVLELTRLSRFRYVWMIPYLFLTMGSYSRNPLGGQQSYSIIVVMKKGEPRVRLRRRDVIVSEELPVVEENIREPLFKPTGNTAVLLNAFTKPGDLVLDPFAGYGSIPLVCELFSRRWIAFEIDPVKYIVAKEVILRRRIPDIKKLKERVKKRGEG